MIGNNDAHGKNFSILHYDNGEIKFAPAYDILCSQVYPELSNKMAMKIGMSRTHLYSLFKNEKEPKFSTIVKIFHELGYELEIA